MREYFLNKLIICTSKKFKLTMVVSVSGLNFKRKNSLISNWLNCNCVQNDTTVLHTKGLKAKMLINLHTCK